MLGAELPKVPGGDNTVLYPSSAKASSDLQEALGASGFTVRGAGWGQWFHSEGEGEMHEVFWLALYVVDPEFSWLQRFTLQSVSPPSPLSSLLPYPLPFSPHTARRWCA